MQNMLQYKWLYCYNDWAKFYLKIILYERMTLWTTNLFHLQFPNRRTLH